MSEAQPTPENREVPKGGWIAWGDGVTRMMATATTGPCAAGLGRLGGFGLGRAGGAVAETPGRCHCGHVLELRNSGDPAVVWCVDCGVEADGSCGPVLGK